MVLDPVPAVDGMLMAVKLAKLPDPRLADELATFEAKKRATRASDAQAMKSLYRDALGLMERVLEVHRAQAKQRETDAAKQRDGRLADQTLAAVVSTLERAKQAWGDRVDVQLRELVTKVDHSVAKLDVEGTADDASGQTTFHVTGGHRDGFVRYVAETEAMWLANNQQLVAQRANEALAEALAGAPAALAFQVKPGSFGAPRPLDLRLKGASTLTPSAFSTLDGAYKIVMLVTGGASGLGFFASRVLGAEVGRVLPWAFGAAFVVALGAALSLAPKRHRQAMARLLEQQRDRVRKELRDASEQHLRATADEQKRAVRKHLDDEAARFRALARQLVGASRESVADLVISGLMPADAAKLERDWPDAVRARLAELG
ncbi:MAG: hypothetical protein IT374_18305 [Polyangiaceae bacterium]|nr:hypothetical protein [Polyangiaceae bacterium]